MITSRPIIWSTMNTFPIKQIITNPIKLSKLISRPATTRTKLIRVEQLTSEEIRMLCRPDSLIWKTSKKICTTFLSLTTACLRTFRCVNLTPIAKKWSSWKKFLPKKHSVSSNRTFIWLCRHNEQVLTT